jgi:hypothetical protein
MEELFPLTGEQKEEVQRIRAEYAKEVEGLQKKLDEAAAAMAAQVQEVRKKFEARANDVLAGEFKAQKQKLDALAQEFWKNRAALRKEKEPALDALIAEAGKAMEENLAGRENATPPAASPAPTGRPFFEKARELTEGFQGQEKKLRDEIWAKMKETLGPEAGAKFEKTIEKFKRNDGPGTWGRRMGRGPFRPGAGPGARDEEKSGPPTEKKKEDF